MEFRELLLGLVLVWLAAKLAGEGIGRPRCSASRWPGCSSVPASSGLEFSG